MVGIISASYLGFWALGAVAAFVLIWPLLKRICNTTDSDVEKIVWSAALGFLIGFTMFTTLKKNLFKSVT